MQSCGAAIVLQGLVTITCLGFAFATDIPPGDVSGTWDLAGSPYWILGDVTVPVGEVLVIEPGVEVVFVGAFRLTAYGVVSAVGAEGDSIRIFGEVPWERLRLENESEPSHFAYCVITGAERGLNSIHSPVVVEHCRLGEHTTAVEIFAVGNAVPPEVTIDACYIHDCQRHGVLIIENDNVLIESCEITRCALDQSPRGAIQLSNQTSGGSNAPTIRSNWIHHNEWQGITGFDLTGAGRVSPFIVGNTIEYNLTGIYLLYSAGEVRDNQIRFNFVEGDPNSGAGVMLYGAATHAVFTGNTLTGNFTAFYIIEGASANLGDVGNADPDDDGGNYMHGNVDPSGHTWSVYSNTVADIKAENNRWDSVDFNEIAETIYDGNDDPAYGLVDFDPIQDTSSGETSGHGGPTEARLVLAVSPNPTSGDCCIRLQRPESAGLVSARVEIFDVAGRRVRELLRGDIWGGTTALGWDGRSSQGVAVPSGVYMCRYRVGGEGGERTVLVLR